MRCCLKGITESSKLVFLYNNDYVELDNGIKLKGDGKKIVDRTYHVTGIASGEYVYSIDSSNVDKLTSVEFEYTIPANGYYFISAYGGDGGNAGDVIGDKIKAQGGAGGRATNAVSVK